MIRVYCDTGAYRKELKNLQENGVLEILQFKYENKNKYIKKMAVPSNPTIKQANYIINEFENTGITINEMGTTSEKYEEIIELIGKEHDADIKHLDSAYRSRCELFLTSDKDDICSKSDELDKLLDIKVFHYLDEWSGFIKYLEKIY